MVPTMQRSSPAPLQHVILPEALARFAVAQFAGKSLQYYDQPAAICAERLACISIEILCEARKQCTPIQADGTLMCKTCRRRQAALHVRSGSWIYAGMMALTVPVCSMNGQPVMGSDRPLAAYRFIRLLALMAVNNCGDRMQPMLVKDRGKVAQVDSAGG